MTEHDGLFLILLDVNNHLLIVANGIVHALGSMLGHWDGRKDLLDFLFHLVDIDVTHHDDGL